MISKLKGSAKRAMFFLGLGALLLASVSVFADFLAFVNTAGPTVVSSTGGVLQDIMVSSSAGGATLNIYDTATAAGESATTLKYALVLANFNSLTVTGNVQPIRLNAQFKSGIVVDTATATVVATYKVQTF